MDKVRVRCRDTARDNLGVNIRIMVNVRFSLFKAKVIVSIVC